MSWPCTDDEVAQEWLSSVPATWLPQDHLPPHDELLVSYTTSRSSAVWCACFAQASRCREQTSAKGCAEESTGECGWGAGYTSRRCASWQSGCCPGSSSGQSHTSLPRPPEHVQWAENKLTKTCLFVCLFVQFLTHGIMDSCAYYNISAHARQEALKWVGLTSSQHQQASSTLAMRRRNMLLSFVMRVLVLALGLCELK